MIKDNLKEYVLDCTERMNKSDFNKLVEIVKLIVSYKKTDNRIFTCGNGGSSATASHIVNDLTKGCRINGNPGFNAMSLNDSTPIITCLANDFSYDEVFKIQLETYAKEGDLLIAFSGSGNSKNVIEACKVAKSKNMKIVLFGGRDGGMMKEYGDITMIAPTDNMEQIEDMHMLYVHAISVAIQNELKGM